MQPFFENTAADLARVAQLLRAGEVVALPTETVYGLAADATNEAAVQRIFAIKGRPLIDPLIVHVATPQQVAELVDFENFASYYNDAATALQMREAFERLSARFWPGPLTLVLPKRPQVPGLVTAGLASVAVRVPSHPLMRRVLEHSGLALAAPSANPFGYISPTRATHVRDSLAERAPYILDGGECACGLESTIVSLADREGRVLLLRQGPIGREALEQALGRPVQTLEKSVRAEDSRGELAPGSLHRHYSPRTPLHLYEPGQLPPAAALPATEVRVLLHRPAAGELPPGSYALCEDGSLESAARAMFALLRRLDAEAQVSRIHWELPPPQGIGLAMRDRLSRAAAQD